MARALRIEMAGLTYHVWARGVGGMEIYRDDRDRDRFIELFEVALASHAAECEACCLMTTHYHGVITTNQPNLSHAMKQLNGRYAEWWNHRHSRPGHVFQGRFGSQVIQTGSYMLNACRYIVLNPVRAHMVGSPEQYRWSSYRATAGLDAVPPFLRPDRLWQLLGGDDVDLAMRRYREFVALGDGGRPLPKDVVLGDPWFVQRFKNHREAASREVSQRDRRTAPPVEDFFVQACTRADRVVAARAAVAAGYSRAEIAAVLGLHPTTVTKMIAVARGSHGGGHI